MKNRIKLELWAVGLFCLQLFSCSGGAEDQLRGSISQTSITPVLPVRLAGHFYEKVSTGIHDSLWAKTIILQQRDEKFAFVFCDLIGITYAISSAARSIASSETGIPIQNILIAATHSHNGPLFYGFQYKYFHDKALDKNNGVDPFEQADYSQFLIRQIANSISTANKNIEPIQLQMGIAEQGGLAFNRRYYMKDNTVQFNPGPLNPDIVQPAGPVDSSLGILLMHNLTTGKLDGGLTVFPMHADCTGGTDIGADYPYFLELTLKKKLGSNFISAFSLGPSGDVNHINVAVDSPIYSSSYPKRIGEQLGEAVVQGLAGIKNIKRPKLSLISTKIRLPLQIPSKKQVDSARIIIKGLYETKEAGAYVANAGGEFGDFLKRVEMSKYLHLSDRRDSMEVEIQVFQIDNENAIVGLPGELFAELGLAIKQKSPFKNTIVLTICNDRTSYIPTRKAFSEGSYEVTNSIVKPGSGEMMVETSLSLLNKLKADQNN